MSKKKKKEKKVGLYKIVFFNYKKKGIIMLFPCVIVSLCCHYISH